MTRLVGPRGLSVLILILFAIAIMGVVMYAICALVEKRMTRWAFRGELVS